MSDLNGKNMSEPSSRITDVIPWLVHYSDSPKEPTEESYRIAQEFFESFLSEAPPKDNCGLMLVPVQRIYFGGVNFEALIATFRLYAWTYGLEFCGISAKGVYFGVAPEVRRRFIASNLRSSR